MFEKDEPLTYNKLKRLKYIDWIQEEVTRIYGPGTGLFLRYAAKDTQISSIPIQKGTTMAIRPMLNHHNPKYFEEPGKFLP